MSPLRVVNSRGKGRIIRVAPPLVITEEQAGVGIDIIDGVMTQVEAE